MHNNNLTLVIPGLFPLQDEQLRLPALERLLATSQVLFDSQLNVYTLLDSLPLAPLLGLAEGLSSQTGWWLRADPVQIKASLNHIQNLGNQHLTLSLSDALTLADELTSFLANDELELIVTHPKRWYFKSAVDPKIITQNTEAFPAIISEEVLPQGKRSADWRILLNQIQMWLYSHPLAQRLQINNLWLWGSGCLPSSKVMPWNVIYGDSLLSRGLARWGGVAWKNKQAIWNHVNQDNYTGNRFLWLVEDLLSAQDPQQWCNIANTLDKTCFTNVLQALRKKRLQRVNLLLSEKQSYTFAENDSHRWWIRSKPLTYYQK